MTKPARILSICPDPTLGETRRLLLENAGYEVVGAQNRHEAILGCGSRRFDLAVLCYLIDAKEAVMVAKDIQIVLPTIVVLNLGDLQMLAPEQSVSSEALLNAVETVLKRKGVCPDKIEGEGAGEAETSKPSTPMVKWKAS